MQQQAFLILWSLLGWVTLYPYYCQGFLPIASFPTQSAGCTLTQVAAVDDEEECLDVGLDERLYRITLSRATGIDWGTDLSFRFVYVRSLDPTGAAAQSGAVRVGDQLCEVSQSGASPTNLIGAPFDSVMQTLADLPRSVSEIDLVFFRGSKDELLACCEGATETPETIQVTVVQNHANATQTTSLLTAPAGVNVRQLLVDNGINVYQSLTRWTNCKGKQLCGTCIVNVSRGGLATNRKSMDEESTLRENPDSYRLSCVTFAYGDITVETFPPVKASQWTR